MRALGEVGAAGLQGQWRVMAACSRLSHRRDSPPTKGQSLDSVQSQTKDGSFQKGTSDRSLKTISKKGTPYRHVPHSQKPQHLVQRRNARERRRVQAVNGAFSRLRKHVPYEPKHKRLSKVKTLRVAIDYIRHLEDMIRDHDQKVHQTRRECVARPVYVNTDTHNIVDGGGRGWVHGHTTMYPDQQRRCPRLVHFPAVCPPVHTNTYMDVCGGAFL